MQLPWLSLPLLLLLYISSPVCSQDSYLSNGWWMDQPYNSDDYNERVEFLDNITLRCEENDTVPPTETMQIQYWVLPDLRVMRANDYLEYYTLDGYAAWWVSHDTRLMYVTRVQEPQFGFYHCHVQDGNETHPTHHVVKKAINYKGPYFTDLWDKYRMNTIIALSAAGGLLLIIICIYVVYVFRYREPAEVDPGESDELTGQESPSFEYPVINKYAEVDDKSSVKPDSQDVHHYDEMASVTEGHQNLGYTVGEDVQADGGGSQPGSASEKTKDAEQEDGMTKF